MTEEEENILKLLQKRYTDDPINTNLYNDLKEKQKRNE